MSSICSTIIENIKTQPNDWYVESILYLKNDKGIRIDIWDTIFVLEFPVVYCFGPIESYRLKKAIKKYINPLSKEELICKKVREVLNK
jgi:hypothetical protein